jgi:hypothetical protein
MDEITIAFDIDGTIITNQSGLGQESLKPHVYALMCLLNNMKNTRIIVWSGGGKEYAEQICMKYGLQNLVSRCYDKHKYDPEEDGQVDIAFDDVTDFKMAINNIIVK